VVAIRLHLLAARSDVSVIVQEVLSSSTSAFRQRTEWDSTKNISKKVTYYIIYK
jgi:hypothetical protein